MVNFSTLSPTVSASDINVLQITVILLQVFHYWTVPLCTYVYDFQFSLLIALIEIFFF